MIGSPATDSRTDAELDPALLGKLERIGQQILEHLLQALRVGDHAAVEFRVDLHVEGQMPVLRFMPERPDYGILQSDKKHFLGVDRDGARFDLGQIQDIADQVHQIGARTVNRSSKFDLLGRQVAVWILAELLA